MIRNGLGLLIAATAFLSMVTSSSAADWPTYRGDCRRSGATAEKLQLPLRLRWRHSSPHAPRPAWPAPARQSYWQKLSHIEPRVVDDRAFHPVAAAGAVFYGSSADDQLRCLDAATGRVRWTFYTDGPVRFAPTVAGPRVYVGSDDGCVYCLNAADGNLLWKHSVGPSDRRIAGNGRIISAWPVRTGLLVDGDTVYVAAGLYPTQGAYLAALGASDGRLIYRHRLDVSPQGYLLACDDLLYVPTGRTNPIAVDRPSGRLVRRFEGEGGTYALITDGELVAGRGNDGTLTVSDRRHSAGRLAAFRGRQMAVTAGRSYLLGDGELSALDRMEFMVLTRKIIPARRQRKSLAARLKENPADATKLREQIAELDARLNDLMARQQACLLWKTPVERPQGLFVAAGAAYVGGQGTLVAYRTTAGKPIWRTDIPGAALGMAVADGRLLVSTDGGELLCFATASVGDEPVVTEAAPPRQAATAIDARATAIVERLLRSGASRQGYALVLGADTGQAGTRQLVRQLAARTKLNIVVVDHDTHTVARLRETFAEAGLYGQRVSVHQLAGERLPFSDYLFNVVIGESGPLAGAEPTWPAGEVERVTRPAGGVAWIDATAGPTRREPLRGAGSWTHQYANTSNTAASADEHIRRDLALQWFGGPGPQRMVDRHLRAPAPLCNDGLLLVPAEHKLIGVDAYNGTQLWELKLPDSQRYSIPYDAGYMSMQGSEVAVAVRDHCWLVDGRTGRTLKRIRVPDLPRLPDMRGAVESHWGYVALVDDLLLGSVQRSDASRTEPSRAQIDVDYFNGQPMVTGNALFAVVPDGDGAPQWLYHSQGAVVNATITVANRCVYFVEARSAQTRVAMQKTGRIEAHVMLPADAYLVALDLATGQPHWERPISEHLRACTNIIFLQHAADSLILTGSYSTGKRAVYRVEVCDAATGRSRWQAEHANAKEGLGHGEQVHHPVVLGDVLIAEPALYDLATGKRLDPTGGESAWVLRRGGGCGTMSGAGSCLFFRAGRSAMMDLADEEGGRGATYPLSPSRPGCWINVIPAGGLVLMPEASAGCVCQFSLQTSMALLPMAKPLGGLPDKPAKEP